MWKTTTILTLNFDPTLLDDATNEDIKQLKTIFFLYLN